MSNRVVTVQDLVKFETLVREHEREFTRWLDGEAILGASVDRAAERVDRLRSTLFGAVPTEREVRGGFVAKISRLDVKTT